MDPWYKVTTPRAEVREGRSFNPDEFAIALEQVVAGKAPLDYRDAKQFFDRTVFTHALTEHLGLVLRRLAGETQNTAAVLSLITQFGGGKTHTLAALYHLIEHPEASAEHPEVQKLLASIGLKQIPKARVAVFVGNAWDPGEGRENPWIDMARRLAGHASSGSGSLTAHIVAALKAEGLLNETVGAGYLDRNWPTALKESGAWPLKGCRQSFLDGSLTRLLDPEDVLRRQIPSFVGKGESGLGSGPKPGGGYEHVWWRESVGPEEVVFDRKPCVTKRKPHA
jgi:hypothetical protein